MIATVACAQCAEPIKVNWERLCYANPTVNGQSDKACVIKIGFTCPHCGYYHAHATGLEVDIIEKPRVA